MVVRAIAQKGDVHRRRRPVLHRMSHKSANRHGIYEAARELIVDVLYIHELGLKGGAEAIVRSTPVGKTLGGGQKLRMTDHDVVGSIAGTAQRLLGVTDNTCGALPSTRLRHEIPRRKSQARKLVLKQDRPCCWVVFEIDEFLQIF